MDCGAYDGDTVRQFVQFTQGSFRRVIAFEPDPGSFAALQHCLFEELDLGGRGAATRAAVAAAKGTARFQASGLPCSSLAQEGGETVECVALDEALAAEHPTFIKLDVEGAEADAILGAQAVIRRHQPLMAVCVYHRQSDLWRIPLMLRQLQPDSRLFLRQHALDGFELVCYSVPAWRWEAPEAS